MDAPPGWWGLTAGNQVGLDARLQAADIVVHDLLLVDNGDVEHGVRLLVGLDLLSELDSEPPAADDEQLLLHILISFRKQKFKIYLNPRICNGSYQLKR